MINYKDIANWFECETCWKPLTWWRRKYCDECYKAINLERARLRAKKRDEENKALKSKK